MKIIVGKKQYNITDLQLINAYTYGAAGRKY